KRPFALGQWMKEGRNYGKRPTLGNLSMFADAFRRWWTTSQPKWRGTSENAWPLRRDGGDETWQDLAKGGPNGLFMFLIPLVWWN
ncbi:hypothetical protein DENSPDRAFT_741615, partial [Dentipellis sp. KUC8613]